MRVQMYCKRCSAFRSPSSISPSLCNFWKEGTAIAINCITMEAEIYGIIPNAKIEALEKAPPENMSNNASNPPLVCSCKAVNALGSIPGRTTYVPKRYIATNKRVVRIRFLRSSIFQIFFIVSTALIT